MATRTKTAQIELADSLSAVGTLTHPMAAAVMDRRVPLTQELIDAALRQSVFGWKGRSPRLLLDANGDIVGSDFDLLSFMVPLAERHSVIEIPEYQIRRQMRLRSDERKIGRNQFGKIKGLTSNKEVFSFCVLIDDKTIATEQDGEEELGAPRNYMLVDMTGDWGGWNTLRWSPTAEENRFLKKAKLWQGDEIAFQYYLHPNRWQSFFGAPYLLLKLVLVRIEDELAFYRSELDRLERINIVPDRPERGRVETFGTTKPIDVDTFEAVLDAPGLAGSTKDYGLPPYDTKERANAAYARERLLAHKWRPKVQFVTRADECAYFRHGKGQIARWAKGFTLEQSIRLPKGRIDWTRIRYFETALRWRYFTKREQVAA